MSLKELIAGGEGNPSFFNKTSPIGSTVTGQIVTTDVRQSRNYETGNPETWDDGNPKQQVVVVLQTDLHDPNNADDDGKRAVYIKWWGEQRKELLRAVKVAGDDDLHVGGTFTATYTGDGPQENARLNPPKLYRYEYVKPSATAGLLGQAQPAPQAPAPAAAPVAAPPVSPPPAPLAAVPSPAPAGAPPAGGNNVVAQVQGLVGLGLDDTQISAATGLQLEAIAAIRNIPAA